MDEEIEIKNNQTINLVNEYILTQYNLLAGLKRFGIEGKETAMKVLRQMRTRDDFKEVTYQSITSENEERALPIFPISNNREG